MAKIKPVNMRQRGIVEAEPIILEGGDAFDYKPHRSPLLILSNPSSESIDPVIEGKESYPVGVIQPGSAVCVRLKTIEGKLSPKVTITNGKDLDAQLLEF